MIIFYPKWGKWKITFSFGYSAGLPDLRNLQELLKGVLLKYLLPDLSKSL